MTRMRPYLSQRGRKEPLLSWGHYCLAFNILYRTGGEGPFGSEFGAKETVLKAGTALSRENGVARGTDVQRWALR